MGKTMSAAWSQEFVDLLNENGGTNEDWLYDHTGINNGYPVLWVFHSDIPESISTTDMIDHLLKRKRFPNRIFMDAGINGDITGLLELKQRNP